MAMTPGTRLGPYEAVAPLGQGGLVLRSRDESNSELRRAHRSPDRTSL